MADVSFEEQQFAPVRAKRVAEGLTTLVQKWGLAKDQKGAEKVLLGTFLVLVLVGGLVVWLGTPRPKPHATRDEEVKAFELSNPGVPVPF